MAIELKHRSEMDARWMWHLSDIFPSLDAFEQSFAKAKEEIAEFPKFQGKVAQAPKAVIEAYFATALRVERLYAFAAMQKDTDGNNSDYQALSARVQSLAVASESAAAFLDPELLEMPLEQLTALQSDPTFAEYSTYLRALIRRKPHTLPAAQEQLLAMAGEVFGAPHNAFSMLSDVDIPFPIVTGEDGEAVKLTHGNYGPMIRSRKRDVRSESFKGMMNAYKAFSNTITELYSAAVKAEVFTAKVRSFPSAREASLFPDEIPVAVYDGLLDAVEATLPAMAHYMSIRKKMLGVDELHLYDLYVPMIENFDMKMTYPEAYQLVLDGLKPLGEEYLNVLRGAYDGGWVDVYENKSKRSGAYSWGCYGSHPFVLLNHTDDLGGAMTLAHELGHAMHSYYSDGAQPYAKAQYSLFVAEVASTCNEVLLMRHLMDKYKDDKTAMSFLCNQLLEEFRTTVFRQTMFAAFEKESHAMEERGEALTTQSLSDMYYKLNQLYYGEKCVVDEEIASEWLRIPHFYRGFYVYKYATGFSAAVAIATRILNEGESAVQDYKKFLSAGGSMPPIEALKLAGVDMADPATVKNALKVFSDTVAQLAEYTK